MKHLVITGGNGNLGKIITHHLHECNYHLHLAVRNADILSQGRRHHYPIDLAADDAVAAWIDALAEKQSLSAGIFLAGGFVTGNWTTATMTQLRNMVELNVATAFNLAMPLLRHFRSYGGGHLIFMGARAAQDPQLAVQNVAYSLSKQMLLNLVELVNASESSSGSSAHILLPGTLDTAANRQFMPDENRSSWTTPELVAETIENILSGKENRKFIPL
jgi:short-subunit dehydrogenase